MPDAGSLDDTEIILAAYAERIKEAFKVFAENLAVGQGEKSCRERFQRSLDLSRKARDLALEVAAGQVLVEPEPPVAVPVSSEGRGESLSAEDQAIVDQALSGTTGAPRPVQRR